MESDVIGKEVAIIHLAGTGGYVISFGEFRRYFLFLSVLRYNYGGILLLIRHVERPCITLVFCIILHVQHDGLPALAFLFLTSYLFSLK